MPPRPDPIAVPLDAAGRTVRAEVVDNRYRERDGRWYWRAREEHQGQRQDVSERVLEGGRWLHAAEAHRALVLYAARVAPQAPQARLRTLGEVLGAWVYAQRQRRDITPGGLVVIEARAKMLTSVPALAAHPTTDRRTMREALERARDELLVSHASTTVAAAMGLLRRAWAWAEERDYVAGAMPLVRTRAKLTRPKPIATPGETAAILATLSGWHAVALRVAVATGARTSELASIDRSSVQRLDEGWLELRGKTGPRAVYVDPMGPAAVALRALSDVFQHELDRDLPAPATDCDDATFTAWNDALEQAIEDRGGPALFAARRAAETALLDAVATWIRSLRTPSAALRNMLDMAPTRPDVQLKLLALAMRLDTNTLARVA